MVAIWDGVGWRFIVCFHIGAGSVLVVVVCFTGKFRKAGGRIRERQQVRNSCLLWCFLILRVPGSDGRVLFLAQVKKSSRAVSFSRSELETLDSRCVDATELGG